VEGITPLIGRFGNDLVLPGAILGLVHRNQGKPLAKSRLIEHAIGRKTSQQLFGRYATSRDSDLSGEDRVLESAQLIMRKTLVEREIKGMGGELPLEDKPENAQALLGFLASWNLKPNAPDTSDAWLKLARLYDQKGILQGDANDSLGPLEAFNFLTDALQAQTWLREFEKIDLGLAYPKTREALASEPAIQDHLSAVDTIRVFICAATTEDVFSSFDTNRDEMLQRPEAKEALLAATPGTAASEIDSWVGFLFQGIAADAPGLSPRQVFLKLRFLY
jgi:hypothetical protein